MFDPIADLAALTTELTTDPNGVGYGADPAVNATLINAASVAVQISRGLIPSHEVVSATVFSELAGAQNPDRSRQNLYIALTGAGEVDTDDQNTLDAFMEIFGPGTVTRTNLSALRTRDGSRAEELFGKGAVVALNYVRQALGL